MKQLEGWDIELINAIKNKLSVKVFLITFFLLVVACCGTFLCVLKIMPTSYLKTLNQETAEKSLNLVETLSAFDNLAECIEAISKFEIETGASVWLDDQNDNIIYPQNIITGDDTETVYTDAVAIVGEDEIVADTHLSAETSSQSFPLTLKNGDSYTLTVFTDLYIVQQSTEVLISIFPYVILMVFVLSILCSAFYSRFITRPILRISDISEKIAVLDFTGKCDEARTDELGRLAHNLNYLSASLSHSMEELHAANAQLKTDIEREREIERQRIDFFAAASHELKTPLTILKGHLSGMLNDVAGYEDYPKYLLRSLTVTEKMEKLIKELLYVSKIDNNKAALQRQKIDFAELLRTEIATLSDCISEKQLLLDVDIPDKIICCLEKEGMERTIQNILVNAIRYSPEGERISVIAKETTEEISCWIENTGVNIPENTISHLFEAFYRTDNSRSSNTGGTGLGLYIVRGVLERHGAKYGIINTEQGVRFWFKLNKEL